MLITIQKSVSESHLIKDIEGVYGRYYYKNIIEKVSYNNMYITAIIIYIGIIQRN